MHAIALGGTFAGTVLTLVFLPAMYSIWFKIRPGADEHRSTPETIVSAVT